VRRLYLCGMIQRRLCHINIQTSDSRFRAATTPTERGYPLYSGVVADSGSSM